MPEFVVGRTKERTETMSIRKVGFKRSLTLAAVAAAALIVSAPRAIADDHVTGVITVRGDTTFTIMSDNGAPLIVAFAESTKIESEDRKMQAVELIPGLRVKVEGKYNERHQLVADDIRFSETARRIANAVKLGLTPTNQQVAENTYNIQKGAMVLQEHGTMLDTHGQTLTSHGQTLSQHGDQIAATEVKTGEITTRINDIDELSPVENLIVYFPNGRATVSQDYVAQLQELAEKAKGVNGYKIQVQGFASAVGPRAFNEALSAQRAEAVTAVLQRGGVPPANIFVPAAMGISEQFAENNTAQGQAENRRVIVTILQSKGLVDR